MKSQELKTLWKCISQELLISEFYHLFERLFSEDSEFWRKILLEEVKHGSLLRAEIDQLCETELLAGESGELDREALHQEGSAIVTLFAKLRETPPSREQALSIALALENTSSEHTYRDLSAQDMSPRIQQLFKSLDGGNLDHIERIKRYAAQHQIQIDEAFELELPE